MRPGSVEEVAVLLERSTATDARAVEDLAYHFDEAQDRAKAYRYRELAARQAQSSFAFARELHHLERAIELAPDADPTLADLYLRLMDAAFILQDSDRAERAGEGARRVAEEAGDLARQAGALRRLARIAWWRGDRPRAKE